MAIRGFASDNNAGIHPKVLEAIAGSNYGHKIGYGNDGITADAIKRFKNL